MEKRQERPAEKRMEHGGATGEKEVKIDEMTFKSPYLDFDDLEDYKMKGYGTHGHQEPKPGRGSGATDAPTPSGSAAAASLAGVDLSATAAINRHGVP